MLTGQLNTSAHMTSEASATTVLAKQRLETLKCMEVTVYHWSLELPEAIDSSVERYTLATQKICNNE